MAGQAPRKSAAVGRRGRNAARRAAAKAGPERQLGAFIAKFSTQDQRLIRAVRKAVRERFATAYELVYDNYNFFVIGYSPTQRPSDAIVSIAARANGVGLCFIRGATLADPKRLLLGSGRQTRFIRVESAELLQHPDVEALIAAAIAQSRTALPAAGPGHLVIRSVSKKQRPRRRQADRTAPRRPVARSAVVRPAKETTRVAKK